MFPGIGVNPQTVHDVASQCRTIQSNLDTQVATFRQQLAALENSLMGPAAETFKSQFAKWQNLVNQMSETLGATSKTLDQIATTAEEQIAALQRLSQ